ncbi:SPFH domain / Band 7 family protein [Acanthocheilonema viteae]
MNEETLKEEDWRYKYRSAFTYAAYNDLDKMGCEAPKRCPIQVGPRYCQYSYSVIETEAVEEAPLAIHTAAVESIFVVLAFLLFLMTLPFSLIFSLKFVGDFERLVVLRLGRAQKIRGPGATVVLPCIDTYTKVDLRVNAFNVPPMQIITFDRGLVELGATIFSQVKDALAAVCAVQERNQSTRVLSVATLRRLVCKRRVSDVISSLGRRELCENLQVELGILTTAWGVEITKVELSEVKVIKEGENMALSTFNKVLKSEVGSQIIEKIKGAAQKFIVQQQQKQQSDHQQQIEKYTKKDITNLSGEKLSEKNKLKCVLNNSLKNLDIDRLLCSLTMVIDKQLVVSVGHIFQVNCTGFGDFYVDLKNDSGNCCKGTNPTADVTFRLSHELLIKILKKEVAPMQAYLDGSLQIMGSLKAAIRLTLLSDRFSCLL